MSILVGKRIVLGVTGSVAAYKAVYLASNLVQAGAVVDVLLTEAAMSFIGKTSFEGITGRRAYSSVMEMTPEGSISHVEIGLGADAMLVAPATADIVAKLAMGFASDIVSATALSLSGPLLIAPAMESRMYRNKATSDNIDTLVARGAHVITPNTGRLASGADGEGRLPEPQELIDVLRARLGAEGPLEGKKIVVTAGGTREHLDPVRYLGNRSTGKQGVALAVEARDRGGMVTLIVANPSIRIPSGLKVISVSDYAELKKATKLEVASCDALIMNAAVGDFVPEQVSEHKIKAREPGMVLELNRSPDLLGSVSGDFIRIGFAAETSELEDNARLKLKSKGLDAIVANDVGAAFGGDTNEVTIIRADESMIKIPRQSKEDIAARVIDELIEMFSLREA